MRVFVTGAASPLGRAVTDLLRQRGDAVVGQVRRRSGIEATRRRGAEPVVADLMQAESLARAMSGCDVIFHLAQFFDFWAPRHTTFHAVNHFGTENTIAAAIMAGVRRVVFCSSALTIGERPGECGTEETAHRGYSLTAFERSKLAAEQVVRRYQGRGIDMVVVNPALVVASGDTGWTGRMIAGAAAGRRRFAPSAPLGWVSVHDAAAGLIAAAERGQSGARYILCGETLSLHQLLGYVARLAGHPTVRPLPAPFAVGGAAAADAVARVFGKRPVLPVDEARFTTTGFRVEGTRACRELGLRYTPVARWLPLVVRNYMAGVTSLGGTMMPRSM